jgi:hypothetical protein
VNLSKKILNIFNVKKKKEFAKAFNKSLGPGNIYNEYFDVGHCMGRQSGGSDLKSNLVYQSARSNRGPIRKVEMFLEVLVEAGFEDVAFVSGVLFKEDINNIYLLNNNCSQDIEMPFPIAWYRVYSAKKNGKYFFWAFLIPYFGLTANSVRGPEYLIDLDTLTSISGIRFVSAVQKKNLGGVNVRLGGQAQHF